MTFDQVAIFVSVIVASALTIFWAVGLTICWAVFHASARIGESMDELSDEIRKEKKK